MLPPPQSAAGLGGDDRYRTGPHPAPCKSDINARTQPRSVDPPKPMTRGQNPTGNLCPRMHSGADALEYFGGPAGNRCRRAYSAGRRTGSYTRRNLWGSVSASGRVGTIPTANRLLKGARRWPVAIRIQSSNRRDDAAVCAESRGILVRGRAAAGSVQTLCKGMATWARPFVTRPARSTQYRLTGSCADRPQGLCAAAEGSSTSRWKLGGKSPMIVFRRRDIETPSSGAILVLLTAQVKICSNGTASFVHANIKEAFSSGWLNVSTPR